MPAADYFMLDIISISLMLIGIIFIVDYIFRCLYFDAILPI